MLATCHVERKWQVGHVCLLRFEHVRDESACLRSHPKFCSGVCPTSLQTAAVSGGMCLLIRPIN